MSLKTSLPALSGTHGPPRAESLSRGPSVASTPLSEGWSAFPDSALGALRGQELSPGRWTHFHSLLPFLPFAGCNPARSPKTAAPDPRLWSRWTRDETTDRLGAATGWLTSLSFGSSGNPNARMAGKQMEIPKESGTRVCRA